MQVVSTSSQSCRSDRHHRRSKLLRIPSGPSRASRSALRRSTTTRDQAPPRQSNVSLPKDCHSKPSPHTGNLRTTPPLRPTVPPQPGDRFQRLVGRAGDCTPRNSAIRGTSRICPVAGRRLSNYCCKLTFAPRDTAGFGCRWGGIEHRRPERASVDRCRMNISQLRRLRVPPEARRARAQTNCFRERAIHPRAPSCERPSSDVSTRRS